MRGVGRTGRFHAASPTLQTSPTRNSTRSAAKRERLVTSGVAVDIDVGAVDHEDGASEREVQPRGVGGVDDGGGDPGRRHGDSRGCRSAPAASSSSAHWRIRSPASGKRSADSQVVLTQIGVRSASRTDLDPD